MYMQLNGRQELRDITKTNPAVKLEIVEMRIC